MLVGEEVAWSDLDGLGQEAPKDFLTKLKELVPAEAIEAGKEALKRIKAARKRPAPPPPPAPEPLRVAPVFTEGMSTTTLILIAAAGVAVIAGAIILLRR